MHEKIIQIRDQRARGRANPLQWRGDRVNSECAPGFDDAINTSDGSANDSRSKAQDISSSKERNFTIYEAEIAQRICGRRAYHRQAKR